MRKPGSQKPSERIPGFPASLWSCFWLRLRRAAVLSVKFLAGCEELAGVRPSPGAATSPALSALDFSPTFLLPHVAAAGDGCTPFWLRLLPRHAFALNPYQLKGHPMRLAWPRNRRKRSTALFSPRCESLWNPSPTGARRRAVPGRYAGPTSAGCACGGRPPWPD